MKPIGKTVILAAGLGVAVLIWWLSYPLKHTTTAVPGPETPALSTGSATTPSRTPAIAEPVRKENEAMPVAVPVSRPAMGAAANTSAISIAHFSDARTPFSKRLSNIQELGRKGDAISIKTLMQVGDAPIYMNRYAVAALGQCRGTEVRAYLSGKLNDPDALLAMAAIRALGQEAAGAAIPALSKALVDNRNRPDGHQDMVCTVAVEALGLTASPAAAPALIAELQRVNESNWNLEYGSVVIRALRNMDSAEGAQGISVYADALAARLPVEPMARAYYERKIAEARGTPRTP